MRALLLIAMLALSGRTLVAQSTDTTPCAPGRILDHACTLQLARGAGALEVPPLASIGALGTLAGVTLGVGSWFFGLAWLVSRGKGRFSERTLLRMERGSGIGLLALALAHGIVMISHLARHGH